MTLLKVIALYRLLVYLTSFNVCSGEIKKALKMTSKLKIWIQYTLIQVFTN